MTFSVANQPIFCLLFFCAGFCYGLLTAFPFDFVLANLKSEWLTQILCFLRIVFLAFFFTIYDSYVSAGEIRLYLCLFCLIGFYLYLKTMGKIIANLFKKLYNKCEKGIKQRRKLLNDLRKAKKNNRSGNSVRRIATLHFGGNNDLPNGNHSRQKSANGRVAGRNTSVRRAKTKHAG